MWPAASSARGSACSTSARSPVTRRLVKGARTALLDTWRGKARARLPELLASLDERWQTFGDAAYLLEPDLKEARGGFRDVSMLRALAATWLTDRPHEGVREPYERLLDVRDALHLSSGRSLDRLLVGEADDVAKRLGYLEADELRRDVSMAARRIGHAVDLTSRAARQAIPQRRVLGFVKRERRPEYTVADHGLIIHQGEVALGPHTKADGPLVGLQAGALAAQRGLVLSPVTADNLGRHAPPLPIPWPAARAAGAPRHAVDRRQPGAGVGGAGSGRLHLPLDSQLGRDPGPAAAQPDPPAHRRPALGADRRRGAAASDPGRASRSAAPGRASPRHRQAARGGPPARRDRRTDRPRGGAGDGGERGGRAI